MNPRTNVRTIDPSRRSRRGPPKPPGPPGPPVDDIAAGLLRGIEAAAALAPTLLEAMRALAPQFKAAKEAINPSRLEDIESLAGAIFARNPDMDPYTCLSKAEHFVDEMNAWRDLQRAAAPAPAPAAPPEAPANAGEAAGKAPAS